MITTAPKNPKMGVLSALIPDNPETMLKETPRAAPPEMPRVYGSTRGLRNMPCRITPLKPSDPPMVNPRIIRGKRISKRMLCSAPPPVLKIREMILLTDMSAEPIHREKRLMPERAAVSATIQIIQRSVLLFTVSSRFRQGARSLRTPLTYPRNFPEWSCKACRDQ